MVVTESDAVIVKWTDEIYKRALERAARKSEWIDTWKNRSKEQRKLDFLDGQLGEEGFRIFLEKEGINYIYYDDIRTDDFKDKDLFDFKVINSKSEEIEISVKSSKLKKDVAKTVSENNILAYPSDVKPVTVQPFIDYKNNCVVLVGWASKEQLEATKPSPLPGYFSHRLVVYHKLRICECNAMSMLSNFVNQSQ